MVSSVSDKEPIWLTFDQMELAMPWSIALLQALDVGDKKRSSPTSWTLLRAWRSVPSNPASRSGSRPSSMDTIGLFLNELGILIDHPRPREHLAVIFILAVLVILGGAQSWQ